MKRLLATAALFSLPAWAGQKVTPWVPDINFPDLYWEAAYRSSWGWHGCGRKLHTHGADVSFVPGPDWDDFNDNFRLGCDYGSRHRETAGA